MGYLLRALLAHYRQHPVQALFLLLGLIMAQSLLVGTQLINAQARASYAQGEQLLGAGPQGQLLPQASRNGVDERLYLRLRRAGFHELAPLLRSEVVLADGRRLELLGIDGLAMPRQAGTNNQRLRNESGASGGFDRFAYPPFELWAAPARMAQLGVAAGDRLALNHGPQLPPLVVAPDQALGHRLLMDIGALQSITEQPGRLSAVLVFAMPPERLSQLLDQLPEALRWVPASGQPDAAELTQSFHLNLAAMGLLAFVVGGFLVYNALAFSYTDRRVLIRRLRLAGVTRAQLGRALLLELGLFLLLGTVLGSLLGAHLAGVLLPGVGQTLAQLYGVYIAYPERIALGALIAPVAMSALAGLLCAAIPLRRALAAPMLDRGSERWDLRDTARRDRKLALIGAVLLVPAALAARWAPNILTALAGMAFLLLGAALLLPLLLRVLLNLLAALSGRRRPLLGWLLADSRWLLGPASLALMAITLALVANSGLNTMIGSFRDATDRWLDQRLAAQLYLPGVYHAQAVQAILRETAPDAQLAQRYRVALDRPRPDGRAVRVEVVDLDPSPRFQASLALLRGGAEGRAQFFAGEGVLVSERASRLDGWLPGMVVPLCAGLEVPVAGVYHDYGNPLSQWLVSASLFQRCWPGLAPSGQAIFGPDDLDWPAVGQGLAQELDIDASELLDQQELRTVALAVFDHTFAVTQALNLLTLLVGAIGLFCAVSAIQHHRLAQQAVLASLGVRRRTRAWLLILQWGLLGLLAMVLVGPFGALLAAYLASVVTPVAFGWSFPLLWSWPSLMTLAITAALAMMLAVLLPAMQLLRATPAVHLRKAST